MLQKINWDTFKIKNENQTKSFEDLCYHLFCREHLISNGIKADFNQAGLETYPIKSNTTKKIVGFQAKFFEPSISYSQIEKSIKKALSNYKKDKLKEIYIYLNVNAVLSSKGAKKIEDISKKEGVLIVWITKSKFEVLLNQPKNFDLAQLYFGFGDELGFIKNTLKKEEITFLNSNDFIKLPLIDFEDKIVEVDIKINKTFLITGNPGSGKSQLMKKLFFNYSGLNVVNNIELEALINKQALPMLINLKDCYTDSLENIIRNRQNDYKVRNNNLKFIYLFDGLDELSEEKAEQIINFIKSLENENSTQNIIISCRKGNLNRLKLTTQIPRVIKYHIDNLSESYIISYFKNKNYSHKTSKLDKLRFENTKLITEINDIYLIKILWEIIEELHSKTTIIHLIEHKVNQLINNSIHKNEIQSLNLFNPKEIEILNLNEDIAFKFSKKFQYRFKQEELQKLIFKKYPRLDYKSINDIINYNSSLFFDIPSNEINSHQSFIYEHRRYQEYFYARKLKSKYERNPKIIRENNLYINADFFEDIFLKYLKSEYKKNIEFNLPYLLELNLIDVYNGNSQNYGADEPYFKDSENFIYVLSKQSSNVLEELISDESLNLQKYIHFSYSEVQLFYENGHKEFALQILNEISSNLKYEAYLREYEGILFVKLVIDNSDYYINYFKKELRKTYKSHSDIKDFLNNDLSDQEVIVRAYFKIGLKYNVADLIKLVRNLSDFELICLLNLFTEVEYLNELLNNEQLKTELKERVKRYNTDPDINNLSIYFFYKFFDLNIGDEKIEKVLAVLTNISVRINSYFFDRFIKPFALVSFIVGEEIFISKLDLKKHPKTQDSIRLYCFVFESYIKAIKGKTNIELIIKMFNNKFEKWYDLDENPKKSISKLWSNIFYTFNDLENTKTLLIYINKISIKHFDRFTFLKSLNKLDNNFYKIINEDIIFEYENELINWNDDYPKYVEKCFDLSGLYSSINTQKAISYFKKAISNSFLRHGWRKDVIISYYLNSSLELIIKNHWKSNKEIINIGNSLFKLNLKLYQITDLKGTRHGVTKIIQIMAKYDINKAKKYLKTFKKIYYDYSSVINDSLRVILVEDIKNNFIPIEKIKREIYNFSIPRDYEQNILSSYYENIFIVYMEVLNSNFYSDDDKLIAFQTAYNQIELAKKEKNYNIGYIIKNETITRFNEYCSIHNNEIILNLKENSTDDYKNTIILEHDFIMQINKANNIEEITELYKKFEDSLNLKIEVKSIETWKLFIDKTYLIESNISLFIGLLRNLHYLDFGSEYSSNSDYLHLGLKYAFSKQEYKQEIVEYFSKESGHSGFYNSIKVYEEVNDKEMCVKLFDRFHLFCDFLVN